MTAPRPRHVLLAGAQRCGTTYLTQALAAHPGIAVATPPRPEPKVFCDAALAARGRDWYVDTWFAHARDDQLLLDKSTSYLEDPATPARAAAVLGDAQVVVLLRDPVQRAISHWRFSTEHGLETRDLEEALLADLGGEQPWDRSTASVSPFAYVRRGRYADHLPPWTATFPSSTHVLFLEELRNDPSVLAGLLAGLGLDPAAAPAPRGGAVNTSPGDRPVLSGSLRGTLQEYFEPSDAALAAQLGRSLPW